MSEDDFLQGDLVMRSLETLDIGDERSTSLSEEIILKSSNNSTKSDDSPNNASPLLDTHQMTTEDPSICPYCDKKFRKPRVLDCLHSLCHDCIIAQLDGRNRHSFAKFVDMELENTNDDAKPPPGVIRCPICTQETHIGNDPMFVNLMLLDFIRIRKYGIDDTDSGKVCQACKSEDIAVANCMNCVSDLCQKCVQAHRDMKMFDGHKVVIFTEKDKAEQQAMSGTESIKTAICEKHKLEFEKFCPNCDELLCQRCIPEHISHNFSPLNEEVYNWCKQTIQQLAKQAQSKGKATLDARSKIPDREKMLSESYEKCRDKIEESFQFYARIMNEVKLDMLVSLEKNREEKQDYLSTLYQKIDKQTNMLQDALTYTNDLLEEGSVVDLVKNRKKVWQQLKLLTHSMPDGNAEVDLDYDSLSDEEFKKKLEMVVGTIKCRVTGLPKETKNLNAQPLLGSGGVSNKLDGFSSEMDSVLRQGQMPMLPGWDSPNIAPPISQQQQPTANYQAAGQGPGAIGMERRLNRNSTNGTSYLSGDSGIYSSASDMTISSPIASQLNASIEQFSSISMGARFGGVGDPFNAAAAFRNTPTANMMQNPLDINTQFEVGGGGALFSSENFNSSGQSKTWSMNNMPSHNIFGAFEPMGAAQRPRELGESRFMMNEFPPLGTDPSGLRSRSSLCNTPSVEAFVSTPVMPIHQPSYPTNIGGRSHFGNNNQLEMTIAAMFSADAKNGQDTFNTPQGLALGVGNEVAIADTNNHRCVVVDLKGNILRQIGSSGTEEGHVYYPKKIVTQIHDRDCRFIVLDRGTGQQFNRLQLFKNDGTYITRLALPCQVDQISVMSWNKDNDQLIIIDSKNLIMTFQFETFNQLSLVRQFSISGHVHEPSDIGVYKGHYYITDYKMHAVVVYNLEGKFATKFGGLDTTPYPVGIDFSKSGDILVGDSHGNHFHIVVFNNQGIPQHHYRCYQQKVSRCTGLKINSEGNILTMSRQNSSIIVFNTLYLPTQA